MTQTEWNYTKLAKSYLKRPQYADMAVNQMIEATGFGAGAAVCDVGAGVAHLTILLAQHGFKIVAVEPNDAMRALGKQRTKTFDDVSWFDGTGENTGQPSSAFSMVTFGSSFNVTDRLAALKETKRILKPRGWFACMWNHRDLDDPLQSEIESMIKSHVPDYGYGTRREDQTNTINSTNLFGEVRKISGSIVHSQQKSEWIEAWRSHATLQRQAGDKFHDVVERIEQIVEKIPGDSIDIPYITNIWTAQLKD